MAKHQAEIWPMLVQLLTQDSKAFTATGGAQAMKAAMMAYGFKQGGVVYAQDGGGIPNPLFAGVPGLPNEMQRKAFKINEDLRLEAGLTPLKDINQYGFSPYEKMFSNVYENLQEFIGGNELLPDQHKRQLPGGILINRDIPGNISHLMDTMFAPFQPGLDPKKGVTGWQEMFNKKVIDTLGEHDPSIYHNKGGVVYAQNGTFTGKSNRGIPFGEFLLKKSSSRAEEGEGLEAAAIGAAKSAGPTAVGTTVGTYVTGASAPVLGPFAPAAGLIAGIGAAGLTAASQEGYLDYFAPQANAEAKRITSENPVAANIGGALPGMALGLAQQGLRSFAGTLGQRTGSGVTGAVVGAGADFATTGKVDLTNLGMNFGTGFAQPMVSGRTGTSMPEETFTTYHGSGDKITTKNVDVTRGGGVHNQGFYTSPIKPGMPGDMATAYAQGARSSRRNNSFAKYEGIYPIEVRGKLSDFPNAEASLAENNPQALEAMKSIFDKYNLEKTTKVSSIDPAEVSGAAILGPQSPLVSHHKRMVNAIKGVTNDSDFKTLPIDFQKATFEELQKEIITQLMTKSKMKRKQAESTFRQAAVEAGIPGINASSGAGKMTVIFDQSRIKSVGSPIQPPLHHMKKLKFS